MLGPDHPSTLITLGNLALLLDDKGDRERAKEMYERCLAAQERVLGPDHPSTLTTLGNLALLLKDMGDWERAKEMYERCLAAKERVLGPDHLNTINTKGNLGLAMMKSCNEEERIKGTAVVSQGA